MAVHDPKEHAHHHDFTVGVEKGERRTRWVVALTLVMMAAELVVGALSGSMALLADGAHMATHAGALMLALFAYWYARTRAGNDAFTFGTGKVYALAGFSSGLLLGVVALWMMGESVHRLIDRPAVDFDEALPVAVIGLLVNVATIFMLGGAHHDHDHEHEHEHEHEHHDHNLRAAYLHVIADALTSVLAIVALIAGRQFGWWFLDPAMGIVGGLLIIRWSIGLCRDASRPLLDAVPSRAIADRITQKLEGVDDVRVADLHLWEIGPGRQGCIVSLVTSSPRDTDYYRGVILGEVGLAHLTVEVHRCTDCRLPERYPNDPRGFA
jgi:cation diffusion facilitator family transporter